MRKATSVLSFIVGLALLMFAATPALADPPGFNGTVKIHEEPGEAEPIRRNEPHVCVFHVHGFNFDANARGWFRIDAWAPTAGNAGLSQRNWGPASAAGEWKSGAITLTPGHYKLFFDQTMPEAPGAEKHKVFWVECETQGTSGTGSTGTSSSTSTTTTGTASTGTSTTTSTTGSASTSSSTGSASSSSTGNANSSSTGNANSSSTGNANSSTGGNVGTSTTTSSGGGAGNTGSSTTTTTTGGNVGSTTGSAVGTSGGSVGAGAGTTGGVVAGVESMPQGPSNPLAGVQTLPATSTEGGQQLVLLGAALMLTGIFIMRRRPSATI